MDGIILIDKQEGWTSHDVVSKLRRILNIQKIGHTGTLDPLATGLLIICVGKATKYVKYLTNHDKRYLAEITLGIKTNTDDITGKIIESREIKQFESISLPSILKQFVGTISQIPPVASAIKINGKRAYEYVHNNQVEPEMIERQVTISSIDLVGEPILNNGLVKFSIDVSCSKGTYIRSLARDIGNALQLPATLSQLRRIQVGEFNVSNALRLEDISTTQVQLFDPLNYLGFPKVTVPDDYLFKVANGAFLPKDLFKSFQDTIVADKTGQPLAIYSYDESKDIMRLSVLI